jgi:hypothetical protein
MYQLLMKMKCINCCKNEQATNIKAKQIKEITKTQNKVKNKRSCKHAWIVSKDMNTCLPLLITNNKDTKRETTH